MHDRAGEATGERGQTRRAIGVEPVLAEGLELRVKLIPLLGVGGQAETADAPEASPASSPSGRA